MKPISLLFVPVALAPLSGCSATPPADRAPIRPVPSGATQPVPVNEVDDAAFWIHPTDPTKSLLLAANERRGLEVHDCDGLLLKHLDDGLRPNNVDVAYAVGTPTGATDVVLATCFSPAALGVKAWRVDPAKSKLVDATSGTVLAAFDGGKALGLCAWTDPRTRRCSYFVTSEEGGIEQYELVPDADQRFSSRRVRTHSFGAKVEGCVVDGEHGVVLFAEEDRGVWSMPLDPADRTEPRLVIRVGEHGLLADVEGLAVYPTSDGGGYLLVVGQGAKGTRSRVHVYERGGGHAHVLEIDPEAGALGTLQRTSGLAVTNRATSARFPRGLLAVNDHDNPNGSEDLKLYDWGVIADLGGLAVDTRCDPRAAYATP